MSSERAGTRTHGHLDREKAENAIVDYDNNQYDHDGFLDALEACVVEDPRVTALESLCDAADATSRAAGQLVRISADSIRAILRGDQ